VVLCPLAPARQPSCPSARPPTRLAHSPCPEAADPLVRPPDRPSARPSARTRYLVIACLLPVPLLHPPARSPAGPVVIRCARCHLIRTDGFAVALACLLCTSDPSSACTPNHLSAHPSARLPARQSVPLCLCTWLPARLPACFPPVRAFINNCPLQMASRISRFTRQTLSSLIAHGLAECAGRLNQLLSAV